MTNGEGVSLAAGQNRVFTDESETLVELTGIEPVAS
jgi:hypothetical protein